MNPLTVKVKSNEETRKFSLNLESTPGQLNNNFNKLNGKIRQLFRIPGDQELVLQWKDSTDDLITFSSDEELLDAIKESVPTGCDSTRRQLRLFIQNKSIITVANNPPTNTEKLPQSLNSHERKADDKNSLLTPPSLEPTNKPSGEEEKSSLERFLNTEDIEMKEPNHRTKSESFTMLEFDGDAPKDSVTPGEDRDSLNELHSLSEDLPPKSIANHLGRFCDLCRNSIRGNRFSCCFCEDYDLCHDCFNKGFHTEHNMTVIRRPAALTTYSENTNPGETSLFTRNKESLPVDSNIDDLETDSAPRYVTSYESQQFKSDSMKYEPSAGVNSSDQHLYPSVPRGPDPQESLLGDLEPQHRHAALTLREMGYTIDDKILNLIMEKKGNVEEIVEQLLQ